jgi:hypothetical protein
VIDCKDRRRCRERDLVGVRPRFGASVEVAERPQSALEPRVAEHPHRAAVLVLQLRLPGPEVVRSQRVDGDQDSVARRSCRRPAALRPWAFDSALSTKRSAPSSAL